MMVLFKKLERGNLPLFSLMILFILSSSCTEDVDIDIFESKKQKVLNSLVCPGKDIRIFLNQTEALSNDSNRLSSIHEIKLYENDKLVETSSVFTEDHYSIPYSVKNGYAYRCEVRFTDNTMLFCEDTIPEASPDLIAYYEYPVYRDEFGVHYGRLNIEFRDISNKRNFYEIAFTDKNFTHLGSFKLTNPVITVDTEKDPFASPVLLFEDDLFQDQSLKMDIYLQVAENPKIILRNVSRHYYEYKKSLYPHLYTRNTDRESVYEFFKGDPFDLYSNVNGGLGIFASYSERIFDSFDNPIEK